jgi:hypothetical protein
MPDYTPPVNVSGARPGDAALRAGGTVTSLTAQAKRMQGNNGGPFGWSFYGPGNPLPPIVTGQPVRQWDYNPGVNTTITPRHMEPFNFRHLRAFSNVELVRMAIETRKDQLERLDWMVKPKDNKKARSKERDPRCIEVEQFLTKPDGDTDFATFFRAIDEDLLSLDAPCMETVRRRNGKLFALELVDGATINLLVDEMGRVPRQPGVAAFQQVIRGVVWADLTRKDLLYVPRNRRTGHIYGFGPVEQIVVTINTIIRRQGSQLAYFTEGNVPAGLLTAPDNYTNEQLRELQEWFDQKISGNLGEQRKLVWVPKDSKYQAFKDSPMKDDFDEWLARIVTFAFNLPPTAFVRQMNKGTANEDQDRALEEGLEPLKMWRKRLLDNLIATEFGYSDLEFVFREDIDIDPGKQSEIDDRRLKNGSATWDEVRDRAGDDPYPDNLGSEPVVFTTTGPVPLKMVEEIAQRKTLPPQPLPGQTDETAYEEDAGGNAPPAAGKPAKPGAPQPKPGNNAPAQKLAKADLPDEALALSIDRPKALRAAAALKRSIMDVFDKARHDIAAQVERSPKLDKAERDPNIEAGAIAESIDLRSILDLHKPLEAEIRLIATDSAKIALTVAGVANPLDLVDQVNQAAVEYASEHAAELVSESGAADTSLVESTRQMIRSVIASGLEENIGRDAIATNIQNSTAFSDYRADMIANTEIARANAAGKSAAYDAVAADGNTMVKEWFVSGDEGVCPECEANDAQGEIPYDEEFDSGDDMEPAHPNCRCVVVARVVDEFDEGDGE